MRFELVGNFNAALHPAGVGSVIALIITIRSGVGRTILIFSYNDDYTGVNGILAKIHWEVKGADGVATASPAY